MFRWNRFLMRQKSRFSIFSRSLEFWFLKKTEYNSPLVTSGSFCGCHECHNCRARFESWFDSKICDKWNQFISWGTAARNRRGKCRRLYGALLAFCNSLKAQLFEPQDAWKNNVTKKPYQPNHPREALTINCGLKVPQNCTYLYTDIFFTNFTHLQRSSKNPSWTRGTSLSSTTGCGWTAWGCST